MVTGPTDKTTISVAKAQLFHRFLDVDGDRIIELELVDTGRITSDGISIYSLATAAALPGSTAKISPGVGSQVVTTAGTAVSLAQFAITALHQVNQTFSINRDWERFIKVGDTFTIDGSTGNDGTYTVVTATYGAGVTVIEVAEAIPNAVADGSVFLEEMLVQSLIMEAKSTNTGNIIPGDENIAAGLGFNLVAKDRASFSGDGYPMDLAQFYIDSSVNGEGVTWYILG